MVLLLGAVAAGLGDAKGPMMSIIHAANAVMKTSCTTAYSPPACLALLRGSDRLDDPSSELCFLPTTSQTYLVRYPVLAVS